MESKIIKSTKYYNIISQAKVAEVCSKVIRCYGRATIEATKSIIGTRSIFKRFS